jgi:hypothetical protein
MEILINNKAFQSVICLKDNKVYVYKIDENPCFIEDDYAVIKCFLIKDDGEPDFSREIEIYGKYLVDAEWEKQSVPKYKTSMIYYR